VSVLEIVKLRSIKLRNGVLIQGLPGIGLVGKIAVDYIVSELKLKKVAEGYSEALLLPIGNAGVLIDDEGILRLPHYSFYIYEGDERDILFLTGDVQPVSWLQHKVAEEVLDFFKSVGGVEVVAVCGTTSREEKRAVYYAAGDGDVAKWLDQMGFKRSAGGTITGACGLVPAIAARKGFKAYVLMGTALSPEPDPEGGKLVVEALSKIFRFKVDLSNLDGIIEELKRRQKEVERIRESLEMRKEERRPGYYV